jgi:hypothetical protein
LEKNKKRRIKKGKEKEKEKRIKKEYGRKVLIKRKRKSISTIANEEIAEIARSVIDQEKNTQIKEEMIFRKIVMRGAEARTIIKKIKIVNTKKRKSAEIVLKKEKRNTVAHVKEKKEAIIDLFIIKTLINLIPSLILSLYISIKYFQFN